MEKRQIIEGKLKFLADKNKNLQPVELWCLNEKVNRNNWKYLDIASHLSDFHDIPILTAYILGGKIISDGHNYDLKRDENGEEYASFTAADAERIVGWIDGDARIQKDEDGIDWVVCRGNLWAFYCHELVQKLKSQGLEGMSISIETLVFSEDIVDGVAYEKDYTVLGVTILNESVSPAVVDASIRTLSHLSEIRDAMKEEILKAASYIEGENSEEIVQENKFNERMRVSMTYFSKKQCAELSKRFEGYTVLAAVQHSKGIHVILLSDEGDTARYEMNSVDETIAVERIKACEGTITFNCDNADGECCDNADGECCDNEVSVDLSEAMEAMNTVLTNANEARERAEAELQRVNESLNAAMGSISEMRNAENARRVQSAKAVAKKTLSAFNATSAFAVSESLLDAVNKDIEGGMYTEKVNADGVWVGEADVEMRVKALCLDEQQKHNQANAEKNKTTFIWDKLAQNEEDDGSVAALLNRMGIRE